MIRDRIRLLGLDPAVANTGIVSADYLIETGKLDIVGMQLIETSNEARQHRQVRQNSDDLRRVREIHRAITDAINDRDPHFVMAEVPTGSQSARSALTSGIVIGLLGCGLSKVPLIQVSPAEVKMASCKIKTATKEEMIAWAVGKYPTLDWLTVKRNGVYEPVKKNEHLADAIAALEAGILTEEFQRAVAMLRVMR